MKFPPPLADVFVPREVTRVLIADLRCRNLIAEGTLLLNGFKVYCEGTMVVKADGEVVAREEPKLQ